MHSKCDGQARPVNVKPGARCIMGRVGEEDKKPKEGEFLCIIINLR